MTDSDQLVSSCSVRQRDGTRGALRPLPGAAKVIKREVDAPIDEMVSELQEAVKTRQQADTAATIVYGTGCVSAAG